MWSYVIHLIIFIDYLYDQKLLTKLMKKKKPSYQIVKEKNSHQNV